MRFRPTLLLAGACLMMAGCHTDMWTQPKEHPLAESTFFEDGAASRPRVEGTVIFGQTKNDDARYKGYEDGKYVTELPVKLTLNGKTVDTRTQLKEVLAWGRERFDAFCSHCHGRLGDGNGMINKRGLVLRRAPATYHTERLRKMPIGHFFDVITNGYGVMYPQKGRVTEADDRWAIAAYIRVLQRSQNPEGAQ